MRAEKVIGGLMENQELAKKLYDEGYEIFVRCGVQNGVKALEPIRKSAEMGYPEAKRLLAKLYRNGVYVKKDEEKARELER